MEKRTENKPGRFSRLFGGSARPRRHHALMIALVLVALLSLAGVVSADTAWLGTVPQPTVNGTVTGDVAIKFVNTWKTDNPINNDNTTAEFTGLQTSNIQFARLYIVPYTASMTENWQGTVSVGLTRPDTEPVTLANLQALDREYFNSTEGTNCTPSLSAPFVTSGNGLCRVTSDFVAIFDVKDYMNKTSMKLYINTTNVSGRFDGRIKEAVLVYGYNSDGGATTRYMINEGMDPSTYYDDGYDATTVFYLPSGGTVSSATLYTNDIASANGYYEWNTNPTTPSSTVGSNSYARVNQFDLGTNVNLGMDNTLLYDRYGTNKWYKTGMALLKVTYS